MPASNPQPSVDSESRSGRLPALVRLTWIFGGIALIYCALSIVQHKGTVIADLFLLLLTLMLIMVRFVDIRYLKGETLDNKPATLKHWRYYALKMSIVTGLLYALAKVHRTKESAVTAPRRAL